MDNQIGLAGIMNGYMMPPVSAPPMGFSIPGLPGMNNNISNGLPQKVETPNIKVDDGVKTELQEHECPAPSLDIKVSNVVCKFRVRCHINLRKLAQEAFNTEHDEVHGKVMIRLRKPHCIANIWSSGKISIFGAKSEALCKQGARRIARLLQKRLNFEVKGLCCFEIVNIMASCRLPFGIKLPEFAAAHRTKYCTYEPELHAAANYRRNHPETKKCLFNLKVFSSGAITGTATNADWIQKGVQEIYPKLEPFRRIPTGDSSSSEDIKEEIYSGEEQVPSKKTRKRKPVKAKNSRKKRAKIETDSEEEYDNNQQQQQLHPAFAQPQNLTNMNQQFAQQQLGFRTMQNQMNQFHNHFLQPLAPTTQVQQQTTSSNEIDYMPPTPAPADHN